MRSHSVVRLSLLSLRFATLAVLLAAGAASPSVAQVAPTLDAYNAAAYPTNGASACAFLRVGACPNRPGEVRVDEAWDSNRSGIIEDVELQCAIDCLDGWPEPEGVPWYWYGSQDLGDAAVMRKIAMVPGGVVELVPRLLYRVRTPVQLPLRSELPLQIRGNGARVDASGETSPWTSAPGQAAGTGRVVGVFERRAPPGANECDVHRLMAWAEHWRFEGLKLRNGAPTSLQTMNGGWAGVILHGATHATIRNCEVNGFNVGVELRRAPWSVVEDSFFSGSRQSDLIIGHGYGCGDGFDEPCWDACAGRPEGSTNCGPGPRVLPLDNLWTCATREGCNGSVVRHTRHYAAGTPEARARSLVVQGGDNLVVDQATFEGSRPVSYILRTEGVLPKTFTARSLRFEISGDADSDWTTPLIDNRQAGRFHLEDVEMLGSPGKFYSQADRPPEVRWMETIFDGVSFAAVQGVPLFEAGSAPDDRDRWMLRDCRGLEPTLYSGSDLVDPTRWEGSRLPRFVRSIDAWTDVLPVLDEPTEPSSTHAGDGAVREGQIWFDPGPKQLKVCCDPAGNAIDVTP